MVTAILEFHVRNEYVFVCLCFIAHQRKYGYIVPILLLFSQIKADYFCVFLNKVMNDCT